MATLSIGHSIDGVVISIINQATFPQLQFFENIPAKDADGYVVYSNGTLSVMQVNLPLYQSFNNVLMLFSESNAGSATIQMGLFTLNVSTLSLMNSASLAITMGNALSWRSFVTSATQNISNGPYWIGVNVISGGASSISMWGNSSANPTNAIPGTAPLYGRMTVSTNAMPSSIATTNLDITGSDAIRFPYIILSA